MAMTNKIYQKKKLRPDLIVAFLVATLAPHAKACPAFLRAGVLQPAVAANRADLALFVLEPQASKKSEDSIKPQTTNTDKWRRLPLQVDPVGDDGVLLTAQEGATDKALSASLKHMPLGLMDRLSFHKQHFGKRFDPSTLNAARGWPCPTERLYEIQDPSSSSRFAYLAACKESAEKPSARPKPVKFTALKQTITSPLYEYIYKPNNQLIFTSLKVSESFAGPLRLATNEADLLLHLDVKNFFTLNLTNRNVNSFVESTHLAELGLVGRIQFYLRLLFFKIDLKMATMASFFTDSANIPMLVDVPVEARKHLNPGSGMLFDFIEKEARTDIRHPLSTVKKVDPSLIKRGYESLASQGLTACRGDHCPYRMLGKLGTQSFMIDITVPRLMVEHGFFPQWVDNVAAFTKAMDWATPSEATVKAGASKVGVYFEVSGLPKGRYQVDYWIRMAKDKSELEGSCPASVAFKRAIETIPTQLRPEVITDSAPQHPPAQSESHH
jgi:hypothetical protein